MVKQKPVWRMNTGQGVPSDFDSPSKILTRKQYGVSVVINSGTSAETWAWDRFYLRSPVISAYQTNRTKAAKFERVTCHNCGGAGLGYFIDWDKNEEMYGVCDKCQGTGTVFGRIK